MSEPLNKLDWEQIERVMGRALELPEPQRAAYLDQQPPSIRAEVESLLAAYRRSSDFLGNETDAHDSVPSAGAVRAINVGTQIGPYRIDAVIGQGGMGVVYRALDTKLNRPVAIKLLFDDVADPAARRRFQREAQTASWLNHPHIVTVHDADEFERRQYLVTEFVDGGTLRDWVGAQKPGWRQIVELLVGVADGLATAHSAGVLHRDIKPENILVSRKGYAKLADFGLAKLTEDVKSEAGTQTLTELTRPGVIQGTVAYMSPEQASGQPIDSRSDIFSFGVVTYELLAGRRPFEASTDLQVLQTIMHGAAPPLPADIPSALRAVVEKALEKQPSERYQSMAEMVVDLRRLARQSGETTPQRRSSLPGRWAWTALLPVLLVLGYLASLAWRAKETMEPLRAVPLTTQPGVHRYPSFSPEGNHVAFMWNGPKQDIQDIYVQQIGAGSALRVTTDPRNDYNAVWSPDGRWIAFLRLQSETGASELRLIAPLGGPEKKLANVHLRDEAFITPPYLAWCPESNCLVVTDSPNEGQPAALFAVSLETGEKRRLTDPRPPAVGDANPAISPDGNWLVFRRSASGLFSGELYRVRLEKGMTVSGEPQRVTSAGMDADHPTWLPGGEEILFSAKGSLWRLRVSGEAEPERLPFIGENGLMPVVSRSQSGRLPRLAYVRSFRDLNIWRVETSAPGQMALSSPAVSISSTRADDMPQFSPDGRRVAFTSDRSGEWEIWVADPDGSNAVRLTFMNARASGYPHWSPNGEWIVFHSNLERQWEVFAIPSAGGKPRNLTSHSASDLFPSFSHDGKWVYFSSSRTGEDRIWKIPASGGDAVQVTKDVGYVPLESPDGEFVYYVQSVYRPGTLWRLPTSGGAPVKVIEGVVLGNFAVLDRGIYYIDRPSGIGSIYWVDRPLGETRLQFLDFATRRSTTVARNVGIADAPLTVSPDGRVILYARLDSAVDDLMLVENFR